MAIVKPFKALRYNNKNNDIKNFICPPYDVIDNDEYEKLVDKCEYNMINLELPKGNLPYDNAKKLLENLKGNEILVEDKKNSIYVYEEEFVINDMTYKLKGFIGRLKLSKFSDNVVIPHEETLSKPKADRLNLMKATNCNFSQIYCLYDDKNDNYSILDKISSDSKPTIEVKDDVGVIHRLWVVDDEKICSKVCSNMKEECLYIADGHHRYETALNFQEYCKENGISTDACNYVMTMFVNLDNSGLVVFPTHRLLNNIANFNHNDIINKCSKYFDITQLNTIEEAKQNLENSYKCGEKAFIMYSGNSNITMLKLKELSVMDNLLPNKSTASKQLDVNILHTIILENILGIDKEKLAMQSNLKYTRNFNEAIDCVNCGESQCAFMMNPTSVSDIKGVSDEHEKMPQKSTYFYPKLITGLVLNEIKD